MYRQLILVGLVCSLIVGTIGCGTRNPGADPAAVNAPSKPGQIVVNTEHSEYLPPQPATDGIVDDRLEDKRTEFDPDLIDQRPLEGWLVNQSAAVIRLDVPLIKPDVEQHLTRLHPSYVAATKGLRNHLPSVNMIDGKAKQFDDGLYAAIDQSRLQGLDGKLPGHLNLIERLLAKVDANSTTAAYLTAGLTLGGRETSVATNFARDRFIDDFRRKPAQSKPIGFYTWSDSLMRCWSFMRFFQDPLPTNHPIVVDLVKVLEADPQLAADCQQAAKFFAKLTNPFTRPTIGDLVGLDLAVQRPPNENRDHKVSLFPASTSREVELFNRLYPWGLPDNVDLMRELIQKIRSGEVDLTPRENSGWYDHQVYALETMLLPERGDEHHKLLLTKSYKKRMLEAFQALITKRRETHVRQLDSAKAASAPPPRELVSVSPRLRVEPCPTFYLRTARSYSFLQTFLLASLGEEFLKQLHGLTKEGERTPDLATELAAQRDLFYGIYLVSCEDIGHAPALHPDAVLNPADCYVAAVGWLAAVTNNVDRGSVDPDLTIDTRVAVPIYVDPLQGTTRLWVTLGVRLTRLETSYATSPHIKPANGRGDWELVEASKLKNSEYLIAVDEFAEVQVPTLAPPTRDELRKICDEQQTKEKIIKALSAGKW